MSLSMQLKNNSSLPLNDIHPLPVEEFASRLLHSVADGLRVSAYFARPRQEGQFDLICLLANDNSGKLQLLQTRISECFPSLAAQCPQLQLFEREVAEQFGLQPVGHPWLKPVRFERNWREEEAPAPLAGDFSAYRVEGEEIHEVAVGPVHAGVIEPGHFRFQCHGEEVKHLEISLGFQHRGLEKLLCGGPHKLSLKQIEAAAGDTSIGHACAYCRNLETLAGVQAPERAEALRSLALELERLANHVGDVGALSGDTGFLPTASYCGSIRGNILNLTAELCGSRFGRGLLIPGGVNFDLNPDECRKLLERLTVIEHEVNGALALFYDSPSVLARMDGVGILSAEIATELGLVGMAARASGLHRDLRLTHPGPADGDFIEMVRQKRGDVHSRALLRRREIAASFAMVRQLLQKLPDGDLRVALGPLQPNRLAVAMVEGWRGELVHVVVTDGRGKFDRYKLVDPSFHNWNGLAMALRGQQISDFPLCNKSFNLSYCGFDL
ncbi:hydrogenase [Geothermobacter hydrogeniphilus]|uniref:Hydrogenase n=1 Tax=Geothermobacter hydrogeniphilus TaxID=1969733 RepID=A0A2K2H9T2_9BACT|nr:NADH-quinone oxidoreductase subunit C [Geothermobacter hydrogeniphilus]PNU19993.1 hydrogenase [Geothermobacter hydrogeniphilus]